jgi:Rod binding domain-containing protein
MSLPAQATTALPTRTSALEPEWIRDGSSTVKQDYRAALQFEQELITQMASSLTKDGELGSGASEENGEESEPGSSVYSSMLPQALASGVVEGGGLGLAAQMTRQLVPGADTATRPAASSPKTGGASAV